MKLVMAGGVVSGPKAAVTFLAVVMAREHAAVPMQAPDQPLNSCVASATDFTTSSACEPASKNTSHTVPLHGRPT